MSSIIDIGDVITSLWDSVKDQIPEKKHEDIATAMIESLMRTGVVEDINDLETAIGVDPTLDCAIKLILEEQREPDYEDETDYNGFSE